MKLYLETSVPNMLFTTLALDRRRFTERLFDEIRSGAHEVFVSSIFLDEIRDAPSPFLRYQLEGIVKVYGAHVLNVTEKAENLADSYIKVGAFTESNYVDALHVAVAVCGRCDVVVSWNFHHIVRAWTVKRVAEVNRSLGMVDVVICTPEEVIDDGGGSGSGK